MSKIKKSFSEVELAYCKKYFKLHLIDKKTLFKNFFISFASKTEKIALCKNTFFIT